MCIDLGRCQAGVAEQRLDATEIGPVIEKVGCEGVAQLMGAERGWEAGLAHVVFEKEPDGTMTESLTALV